MTREEEKRRQAQDEQYVKEWNSFWEGLTPAERAQYEAVGIYGPELTTYSTKRSEFDSDRVVCSTSQFTAKSSELLPELERIWSSPSVPSEIVATLGNLNSPLFMKFRTETGSINPEISPLLRILLEMVQSEPQPGLGLAVVLKWFGSEEFKGESDRDICRIFGITFQSVSICRERLSQKFGCFIFAGKSESAKKTYSMSNPKKLRQKS